MPVSPGDVKLYGSAVMPDSDGPTQIGGAITLSKKPWFVDPGQDALQVVSTDGGDTTQTITVSYRTVADPTVVTTLVLALNGRTVVTNATQVYRALKALKSATCAGRVAVEGQVAIRTGALAAAAASGTYIVKLDAGASIVTNAYRGLVLRLTAGPASGDIYQVAYYDGPGQNAHLNEALLQAVDGTTQFRLSKGMYFDKAPAEITEVRRLFYLAAASAPGGGAKAYHEIVYWKNTHASLPVTVAQVLEQLDPSGRLSFGIGTALNTAYDNGPGNNRLVAPAAFTFDSLAKADPTGQLPAASYLAMAVKLSLLDGDIALNTTWSPAQSGQTV